VIRHRTRIKIQRQAHGVNIRRKLRSTNRKNRRRIVLGGLREGNLTYAAVFLAGNFSLIRADLPLRSRR